MKYLLLILLLVSTASACDSMKVDNDDIVTISVPIGDDIDSAIIENASWSHYTLPLPVKYDTTTHYVAGVDTVPRWLCVGEHSSRVLATPVLDTIWKPLITVKLRPDQIEALLQLLKEKRK